MLKLQFLCAPKKHIITMKIIYRRIILNDLLPFIRDVVIHRRSRVCLVTNLLWLVIRYVARNHLCSQMVISPLESVVWDQRCVECLYHIEHARVREIVSCQRSLDGQWLNTGPLGSNSNMLITALLNNTEKVQRIKNITKHC